MYPFLRAIFLSALLLFVLSFEYAHAQLINYQRRMERSEDDPVGVNRVQSDSIKVTHRIEKLYDINQDGLLQNSEMIDLLENVVLTVQKDGSFPSQIKLLSAYDTNEDGLINPGELAAIKDLIERQ